MGKLCALFARALPRDLYDAIGLPLVAKGTWHTPHLRSLFVAMAGTLNHPLHSFGAHSLERVTQASLEEQLYPMLTSMDRPQAERLKEAAWKAVGSYLTLSDAEREYTDRLQTGELMPELLFPEDQPTAELLRRHPALLWKAQNAKNHGRRRH